MKPQKGIAAEPESRILNVIESWASRHPDPDKPAINLATERYTPRQIMSEVRAKSTAGRFILKVLEHRAKNHSPDDLLKALDSGSAVLSRGANGPK